MRQPRPARHLPRLSDAAELYRAWSGAWADGRQPVKRDIATEHRELMEAALAHDAGRACQLFEAHVDRTAAILLDLDAGAAVPSAAPRRRAPPARRRPDQRPCQLSRAWAPGARPRPGSRRAPNGAQEPTGAAEPRWRIPVVHGFTGRSVNDWGSVRFVKADTEQGPRLGVLRPDGVADWPATESRLEPYFGDDGRRCTGWPTRSTPTRRASPAWTR